MGYYTEFRLHVKLMAPETHLVTLEALVNGSEPPGDRAERLFQCERYRAMFASPIDENSPASSLKKTRDGGAVLSIQSRFKNYDDEIEKLREWIEPFVQTNQRPMKCGSARGESGSGYPIMFGINPPESGDKEKE
jgi:hypothetical protein